MRGDEKGIETIMKDAMTEWEKKGGVKFLRKIGLAAGQTVLDFGARIGHYSIPAARIVGSTGRIYALDQDRQELDELSRKIEHLNLNNIEIVPTNGGVALDFEDEAIDVVLFYDVLHYLERQEREKLYIEARRVLKGSGFISVYPKHVIEDSPLDQFEHCHWDDVRKEIQDPGFEFEAKYCDTISHDDFLNSGCVFNFIKDLDWD